jgi:hypothetical protein
MSALLFALSVAAAPAPQVIQCPPAHQGKRLTGAGVYEGQQRIELMGAPRRVPGGIDTDFGFNHGEVKWLACWYEPATPVWHQISPKATRCELKQREPSSGRITAVVRCK